MYLNVTSQRRNDRNKCLVVVHVLLTHVNPGNDNNSSVDPKNRHVSSTANGDATINGLVSWDIYRRL